MSVAPTASWSGSKRESRILCRLGRIRPFEFEFLKRMDDGRPAILLEEGFAGWRWSRGCVDYEAEDRILDRVAG
jgi:hypothetical protein